MLRNTITSNVFHHRIVNFKITSPWLFLSIFLFLWIPHFCVWWCCCFWCFYLSTKFKSFFLFLWRANFVKSVLFCVGRIKFVLIDSTKVVLLFSRFLIVSCLFCIFNRKGEFSFSRETIFVSRILIFKVSVIIWLSVSVRFDITLFNIHFNDQNFISKFIRFLKKNDFIAIKLASIALNLAAEFCRFGVPCKEAAVKV